MSPDDLSETIIIRLLAEAQETPSEEAYPSALLSDAPRPAAVLVPFLRHPNDGSWCLLFTRRTETLAEHRGQVAFPGGRWDPADPSPEYTALREAEEEIGLDPRRVTILGRLNSLPTITNYLVTPIIGVIPGDSAFRLNPREVSRVFTIPLSWLADPANRRTERRTLPGSYLSLPVIYFQPYDNETLWGISAQIAVNLLNALRLS